ncbi:MAG: PspC domain-containing protein [Bacteroidota bacterium]
MKRLYLSRDDRKIGGVCGGIAEYMEVDPTIIRLLAVVLAIFTALFPMFIGYLIAWLVIPPRPKD